MCHLVDADRHCQDDDIILTGLDLNAVGIANAEPFLRDFGNLVTAFTDAVFVIEDIAFDFQVGAVLDLVFYFS